MSTHDELNRMFPDHYFFYNTNLPMGEALEHAAKIMPGDTQVINYNGQTVIASAAYLPHQNIDWISPVGGTPEPTYSEEVVTVEATEAPTE